MSSLRGFTSTLDGLTVPARVGTLMAGSVGVIETEAAGGATAGATAVGTSGLVVTLTVTLAPATAAGARGAAMGPLTRLPFDDTVILDRLMPLSAGVDVAMKEGVEVTTTGVPAANWGWGCGAAAKMRFTPPLSVVRNVVGALLKEAFWCVLREILSCNRILLSTHFRPANAV